MIQIESPWHQDGEGTVVHFVLRGPAQLVHVKLYRSENVKLYDFIVKNEPLLDEIPLHAFDL